MKNSKIKNLLTLFLTFFKVGAFTFGGGYGHRSGRYTWALEAGARALH